MIIVILLLIHLIHHCSLSYDTADIRNGVAAKYTCSDVWIGNRTVEEQVNDDVGSEYLENQNITIIVNRTDSSVIAYSSGSTIRKAIYRSGLGATLISGFTEKQIRSQKFNLPSPPNVNQDNIP
ncbi:unnamed protein product, partial [Adineta steineri]